MDLNVAPPGLASFQDLYLALLTQYEAVSFGDWLFGCWLLLPLQRRYSATMKLAVFGEHVGMLRSLGVTIEQVTMVIFCLRVCEINTCIRRHLFVSPHSALHPN